MLSINMPITKIMRKSYLLALVALLSWPSQESRATDGVINSIGTAVATTGEVLTDGDTYLIYNTNAQNGGTSAYLHEDVSTHSLNITAGSSNPVVKMIRMPIMSLYS